MEGELNNPILRGRSNNYHSYEPLTSPGMILQVRVKEGHPPGNGTNISYPKCRMGYGSSWAGSFLKKTELSQCIFHHNTLDYIF